MCLTPKLRDFLKDNQLFSGVVLSGCFVGFSNFERHLFPGSILAEMTADFKRKPTPWALSLFYFVDFEAPSHDYPSRANKQIKLVKISRLIQEQITMKKIIIKETEERKLLTRHIFFTLKSWRVKNKPVDVFLTTQ